MASGQHHRLFVLTGLDAAVRMCIALVKALGTVQAAECFTVLDICWMLLQALLHLLLDLSETGVTLAILWRCLAAFRPLALGWFPLALRPLRRWLLPVIGAARP